MLFGPNCYSCGTIPCYADDASIVYSRNSRVLNQEKIIENLDKVENFPNLNKLAMNRSKTTINEIMIKQKRMRTRGQPPTLQVLDSEGNQKTLTVGDYTRLLGCNIGNNLSWRQHLMPGEKAVLSGLRKQLGALTLLADLIPLKMDSVQQMV